MQALVVYMDIMKGDFNDKKCVRKNLYLICFFISIALNLHA